MRDAALYFWKELSQTIVPSDVRQGRNVEAQPPKLAEAPPGQRRRRFRIPGALFVPAGIVALILAFYGIEHWRGRHAWKKHERQLLARGEPLDHKALLQKPVPDAQNFAATPFVVSWFVRPTSESTVWNDGYVKAAEAMGEKQEKGSRGFIDLEAWQRAFEIAPEKKRGQTNENRVDPQGRRAAAHAILKSLEESEARLSELRAASARPHAVYPVQYQDDIWGILLPHLRYLKSACARLQLRACAALATGESAAAFEDVKLMLYLADSVKDEPYLISFLIRGSCRELAIETIWEGLAQRAWSESQLQQLQAHVQRYECLKSLKRALQAEHAGGLITPELVRRYGMNYMVRLANSPESDLWPEPTSRLAGFLIPTGWVYMEKLSYSRFFHIQQRPLVDENGAIKGRISPADVTASTAEVRRELKGGLFRVMWDHKLFAGVLVPAIGKLPFRAAKAQTSTDHAALACALERYRLAKGNFPDRLEALVPQFIAHLPKDLLTGEFYKYRRTDDGGFMLYSVGWNETDDGGVPGEQLYDDKQGDWIWSYSWSSP